MPLRLQRKRTKGFRLPQNTICVTRPSRWGNPYHVGQDGTAQECVDRFWECFVEDAAYRADVKATLAGKNLACFCSLTAPCHADLLLQWANT